MADPLKILVIGGGMYVTGRGADGYFGTVMPALLEARRSGQVSDIAIATTRAETAKAAAAETQSIADLMGVAGDCHTYPESGADTESWRTAIDDFQPDAAIIVVPDHLHADIGVPVLESKVPCLMVKPLAGTLADADRLVEAARKAGMLGEVEFHKRLDESNLMLRQKIRAGGLGTPLYATVEYSQRKMVPRDIFRGWAARTSIFQYLGVHYVDLIGWATGFTPVRATAWGQREYLTAQGIDTWDAIQAVIEWQRPDGGPFVSNFATNWVDPDESAAMSDQRIIMVGTEGRFDADQTRRGIRYVGEGTGVQEISPYFTGAWTGEDGRLSFHGYGIASVRRFLDDVADISDGRAALAALEQTRPTFAACRASVAVIDAVHESLANGSNPVEVAS